MRKLFAVLALLLWTGAALAAPNGAPAAVNGCRYSAVIITLANGQQSQFACDANGNLLVNFSVGGAAISAGNPLPVSNAQEHTDLAALLAALGSPFQSGGSIGNTNFGGYDSGTSPVQSATPANASHTAGQSVGGLYSIPIARTNGGSGLLEQITLTSVGGDTPTLQVRLWDRAPTNSSFACTDNAAYAAGSGSTGGTVGADQSHLLTPPFTITLAAPGTTTGDAYTYASYSFVPPLSFKNQDSTPSKNVYACLQATTTYTPGIGAYYVDAIGPQD